MAPQTPTSPYIQQLYAASAAPYGQVSPNIMRLMQSGNPLLDMYTGQYAAMGYPATPAAVTQPGVVPAVTQSLALDASQANAAVAGRKSGDLILQSIEIR